MAITYVGSGTPVVINDSYDLPIAVGVPSGTQENDFLIMLIKSTTGYNPSMSGWQQLNLFPAAINTDPCLHIYTKFAGASEGATTINISVNNYMSVFQIFGFRGVHLTSPIHTNEGGYDQLCPSILTMTFEGTTTTVDGCMILNILANARDVDSTAQYSGWANASLVSIAEICDYSSAAANGGGLGMACGIKATAGVVAATTATRASTTGAVIGATLSLAPIPPPNNGKFFAFF